MFTEVIVAPDATDEAIKIIAAKKNLRLLLTGALADPKADGLTVKSLAGGLLVQGRDNRNVDDTEFKVVTKKQPDRGRAARPEDRHEGGQARQVERHHLRQGRCHRRHRRRPDEPRSIQAASRTARPSTRPRRPASKAR